MLKNEKIEVYISYRNYTHYIKLGYDAKINQNLEILTIHLPSSSHVKVDVICEICKRPNNIIYHKYIENKKRHNFYGCKSCSRQKAALTSIEKYGVDNYSKTDDWKNKVEKTNIERFGFKTNLINPIYKEQIKNILIEKYGTEKHWNIRQKRKKFVMNEVVSDLTFQKVSYSENLYENELILNEYHSYRSECRKLTKRNFKQLLESWDGKDYYDNEYIENNFNLEHNDPLYPTIDHKRSIYFGFVNKIDPVEISDLSNLCFTKRSINSRKRDMNDSDFISHLKSLVRNLTLS